MKTQQPSFTQVVSMLALVWIAIQATSASINIAKVAENITRIDISVTYTTDLER